MKKKREKIIIKRIKDAISNDELIDKLIREMKESKDKKKPAAKNNQQFNGKVKN